MARVLGVMVLAAGLVPTAWGQAFRGGRTPDGTANPFSAVLHPSEEATTLMSRANQGLEREDWKLVIDSLQRIIELPGEHVLTADGKVYESARRHAHRRIAQLPPEGLAAYRLMYDGEAAALLAQAVERHDADALRGIVDRYLITRSGDDAAMTLAEWLMDEGQFAAAAAVIQLIQALYPDSDLPAGVISARLAVCYAGLGRSQRAEALLKDVPALPAGLDPEQWKQRLADVAAFLKNPIKDKEVGDPSSWALAYGRPTRDGLMPLVEPSFADHVPWVVPLNVCSRDELAALEDDARQKGLLPGATMVVDDRLLVVKAGPVLQALDVDTFEVVWRRGPGSTTGESAIVDEPSSPFGFQADPSERIDNSPAARRLLRDSVGSGVALAYGLVLTVEWAGDPPQNDRPYQRGYPGPQTTYPNRIVAYALKDGKPVWETSSRPGENRLGAVEFLSVPVPVNGLLFAPCRVNTDLYGVLIDPATGRMIRHMYLCGTGGGAFDSLYALQPCVADGVVYIPTGRGVVIALESASGSIRWVVRYEGAPSYLIEDRWLPTPAIAVADSVLVAPQDADYLLCIDRATGEIRWRAERDKCLYVLGANDRHAWLGGPELVQLDVETGKRVWARPAGEPSGRGAICGDRVYLPTTRGLRAFKAAGGEPIALPQPPAGPLILGNLLACNTTLYSTDLSATREFPDLVRGYEEAVARHRADRRDPANAIRLARLELLRRAPARALDALADLPADLEQTHRRRFEQAAHMKVVSMLELSASDEVSSEQARRLLEQARAISVSPQDAIDSALALGDYLRREERPLEACSQYLSLILSREGDAMISDGEDFQQRARGVAVRRLADVVKTLEPEPKARFEETLRNALVLAEAKRDVAAAGWLAESGALGAVSCEAEVMLGRWAVQDLRFEQAEACFNRAIRRSSSAALTAEAVARLAALYVQPDELHLPVWASGLVDRLEREFGAVELPADVLDVDYVVSAATRPAQTRTLPGARIASMLRERVNPAMLARHQAELAPATVRGLDPPRIIVRARGTRPLLVRETGIEPLADRLLTLVDGTRVDARTLADDSVLWPADLRLLDEMAVESRAPDQVGGSSPAPATAARGLVDGQILIVHSAYGIHAVGLLTGRRLWSRKFEPPVSMAPERGGTDTCLWVQDGYVLSINRFGELEVAQASAGDRVLWRRRQSGRRWTAVRARGQYIVAVDGRREQADVFRLADGRFLGTATFEQPGGQAAVNLSLFDDVICGPVSAHQVAAFELETPGVERWRVATESELFQAFKPTGELLAVADRAGRVQLIDPRTGKPAMNAVRVEACGEGIRDGSVSDGVFYVCGYRKRGSDDNNPDRLGLAAIRVSDRKVLWQRDDLGPGTWLNQEVLECSANAIPLVTRVGSGGNQQLRTINSSEGAVLEVTLLDKAGGKPLGEPMEVPLPAEAAAMRILNVRTTAKDLRVVAGLAMLRFPFTPAARPPAGDDK
ncbi:MAG: PQQ-binding-like beta-propeller repeat protein [Phycisphaerae bacterium]|jgi:outer membrane protein assembly factor BamB